MDGLNVCKGNKSGGEDHHFVLLHFTRAGTDGEMETERMHIVYFEIKLFTVGNITKQNMTIILKSLLRVSIITSKMSKMLLFIHDMERWIYSCF